MAPEIEIVYPCPWEFKVVGPSESAMRQAIAAITADLEHTVAASNTSRSGKYCSLLLTVTVATEDHRNHIFVALSNHADILFVL